MYFNYLQHKMLVKNIYIKWIYYRIYAIWWHSKPLIQHIYSYMYVGSEKLWMKIICRKITCCFTIVSFLILFCIRWINEFIKPLTLHISSENLQEISKQWIIFEKHCNKVCWLNYSEIRWISFLKNTDKGELTLIIY